MAKFRGTYYYETQARFKHPEAKPEWIDYVLEAPEESRAGRHSKTGDERMEHWRYTPDFGHYLLVVAVPDGRVQNAFFDGDYPKRKRRERDRS